MSYEVHTSHSVATERTANATEHRMHGSESNSSAAAASLAVPVEVLEAELRWLEDQIGIALPDGYRVLLLHYPDEIAGEIRNSDLFDKPARIARETRVFQRYLTAGDEEADRWIVIGSFGDGDRICLDVQSERVNFWCREDDAFEPIAASIADYYRIAITDFV